MAEDHQDGLLEPSDVAEALRLAIEEERFMVLTHPIVGEYFKNKAMDYQRYIYGMNRLKQKIGNDQLPS